MKKMYSIVAVGLSLVLSGCGTNMEKPSPVSSMEKQNERTLCNVEKNGIEYVLKIAKEHNDIAKKHGVEFKRLGMTNTQYIQETQKALLEGEKKITLLNGKKQTKNSVTVEYAATRACKFALGALTQEAEGKKTWRDAVPGDGFKY